MRLSPDRIQLLRGAVANLQQGRFAAAEQTSRLLLATGHDAQAELVLGLALGAQGEMARAMPLLDRAAEARPDHAHPCRDLGELLAAAGRPAEAIPHYQAWLARAPGDAAAHHALGLLCADIGRFADAILHFERAVTLDPRPAMGWSNLGMMLKIEGGFERAIAAHDEAVTRAPEDSQIRVNRAVALLHAGRMTEAWRDYEYRLRQPGHTTRPLDLLLPEVTGLDLTGRTILVTHEDGYGDTLQFIRYVPLLAASGARVILEVPPPLIRLLSTLEGVTGLDMGASSPRLAGENQSETCAGGAALGAGGREATFDYHCPVFSLPRAFATTVATVPGATPYLRADPGLVAAWSRRLPPATGRRIGLVWAGQARPWLTGFTTLDSRRSTSLAQFAPLAAAVPEVQFISLQKGPAAGETRTPPTGMRLHDPGPDIADFADTAAIIANLDLVISVDTSVVHLAGALGKPVFLLDRYDNCWRWLSGREDSPWYPTLRIFRQERLGDWTGPMRGVAAALRAGFPNAAGRSKPRA